MSSPRLRSGQAWRALPLWVLVATVASADPSGRRWATPPVTFQLAASVNNAGGTTLTGSQAVAYSTVVARMQAAFSNWTAANVTSCTTTWNSTNGPQFSTPSGIAGVNGTDNLNHVMWLGGPIPGNWRYSSGTLGLTTTGWFTSDPGTLIEADMELNDNVDWSDGCAGGQVGAFDYESVVLHEAGHFLGLAHTTSSSIAVMYAIVAPNACKRTLATPDSNDVCTVYPSGSGTQGSACATSADCTGGRVCKGVVGATALICTTLCTTSADCTAGYTCQTASGLGLACLPQVGPPDLCKFCTGGGDCSTGLCVTDAVGHLWCSSSCGTAPQCGPAYNCLIPQGLCAPIALCTNQCTGSGQSTCAIGYLCVSGTCEPTGNPGDHCELTSFCKACGICIGTDAEAYCRSCCGGGSECNGCPNPACGAGNTCLPLVAPSTAQVCIPNAGIGLCNGTCSASNCLNGASCIAGRCHTLCNPQSPGTCGACLNQGGNGVCACSDEVATTGQLCGVQPGGGIFACQSGLACVGMPLTCRRTCTIGVPGTCAAGDHCNTVSAQAVCLPDQAPVANPQSVATAEDTAKAITLTGSDPDGDPLTFVVGTQPAHGALTGSGPSLTYTPAANYFGSDSFTFKANDGTLDSPSATVAITVGPVNDAPVATAQAVITFEDTAVVITLGGTDVEGATLTLTVLTQPSHGALTGTGASRTYTPATHYNGVDSFTFKANDGALDSAPATISITVTPVNDAPVAAAQTVTTAEDTAKLITLVGSDVDGDPLTFLVVTPPSHGALSGSGASLTYLPVTDYYGSDSFTFKANDGVLDSARATVFITVTAVNDAPVADAQSVTVAPGAAKVINLTGSDAEGDFLMFTVVSPPTNGALSGTAPNLTYRPASDFKGTDSFTFTANDGVLDSAIATVSINVTTTPVGDGGTGGGGGSGTGGGATASGCGCTGGTGSTQVMVPLLLAAAEFRRRRKK